MSPASMPEIVRRIADIVAAALGLNQDDFSFHKDNEGDWCLSVQLEPDGRHVRNFFEKTENGMARTVLNYFINQTRAELGRLGWWAFWCSNKRRLLETRLSELLEGETLITTG